MKSESDLDILIVHAEDDFDMVRKALRGKKPSTFGACFHAQQCAEKYMKALLAFKEIRFPFTHDLNALKVKCASVGINIGVEEK